MNSADVPFPIFAVAVIILSVTIGLLITSSNTQFRRLDAICRSHNTQLADYEKCMKGDK